MAWNDIRIYTPSDFQAELWTEEEISIFELFHYRCIRCGQKAITLHERKPKSLNINWKDPENRDPLCFKCHNWAHRVGTKISAPLLKICRRERLKEYATQH